MLDVAEPGATFLLNSPYGAERSGSDLPVEVQRADHRQEPAVLRRRRARRSRTRPGSAAGSTRSCRPASSRSPASCRATRRSPRSRRRSRRPTASAGERCVEQNFAAVDAALDAPPPGRRPERRHRRRAHRARRSPDDAPDFVQRVTARDDRGQGRPAAGQRAAGRRHLPDGHRAVGEALDRPGDPDLGSRDLHPVRQVRAGLPARRDPDQGLRADLGRGRAGDVQAQASGSDREQPGDWMTIQVAPDDCTGCGICVDVCPAKYKEVVKHKAINMEPKVEHLEAERANWDFFLDIPELDRASVKVESVKGSQLLAAAVRVLRGVRRLRRDAVPEADDPALRRPAADRERDRLLVDLRRQPADDPLGGQRRGPRARPGRNSLFEDNAEFGLGMRLAARPAGGVRPDLARAARRHGRRRAGRGDPRRRAGHRGADRASSAQRVAELKRAARARARRRRRRREPPGRGRRAGRRRASGSSAATAGRTTSASAAWTTSSRSGRDVNILVLDTEVYSNTGGQASKATPRGAVAKFAAGGKATGKKDLGMIADDYGNVYVAQIAHGGRPRSRRSRRSRRPSPTAGPSLLIAYSHCIAHGIDMSTSMRHQKEAAQDRLLAALPLRPAARPRGQAPVPPRQPRPRSPSTSSHSKEARFAMLARAQPGAGRAAAGPRAARRR